MIKFALIGTGHIAHVHAKAIKRIKGAELIAVKGSDNQRTKDFAGKYNIKDYLDYDELLKNKDINAVDIVTLNNLHADLGIKAAQAGKHVLVEKPIDISLEKAENLIRTCQKNKVKLGVISQKRFDKSILWLKKEINSGTFGNLILGNASVKWNRTRKYFDSSQQWRKKNEISGGGVLILQAIHYIDLLLWLFGGAESVYGKIDTKLHDIEGEDIGLGIIKFKSGALATISATTTVVKNLPDILEVHGDKGSAVLTAGKYRNYVSILNLKNRIKKFKVKFYNYFVFRKGTIKDQIKNFVYSIQEEKEPLVTGIDGKNALELVLAIYKSSKTGKEIKL